MKNKEDILELIQFLLYKEKGNVVTGYMISEVIENLKDSGNLQLPTSSPLKANL